MNSLTDRLNAAEAALAALAQAVSDAKTMHDTAADWLQPESEAEAASGRGRFSRPRSISRTRWICTSRR